MTPETMPSFAPALLLLALMLAAAWGVKWLRQRYAIGGALDNQALKVVSALAVGPQQRVLVLELTDPQTRQRHLLTVGVTPQQITALHSVPPQGAAPPAQGLPPDVAASPLLKP